MALDFRNTNSLWASVLVETLRRLGLETAIISPGSRSAPLVFALSQAASIETLAILDERSAAFFALGLARRRQRPILLVCTSGTAGSHYFPALIEAHESRLPLLVCTADRPAELRHCHSGQTIDQERLFGTYPNWFVELAAPSPELDMLRYLRQTAMQAWRCTLDPQPGPVHLNLPFRDPLQPLADPAIQEQESTFPVNFFAAVEDGRPYLPQKQLSAASLPLAAWRSCQRGLIIAGPAQTADAKAFCHAIAHLSQTLGWPVLADGLSPLRNWASLNPNLVAHYDLILRNREGAKILSAEMVLQCGPLPTSKELRTWLAAGQPLTWQVDIGDRNLDPLHNPTQCLPVTPEQLAAVLPNSTPISSEYLQCWQAAERQVGEAVDATMRSLSELTESKLAWLLSQALPPCTPLFIANSTPVRDVEWFWRPGDREIVPYCNRGANGIDGTLSTALGVAHRHRPSVLLTGDLALLHDTNGFLCRRQFVGHLTIVLVNNLGGGIFNLLPVAQFEPPFEQYFATPQDVDFAQLCRTYGVTYQHIESWSELAACLDPLPTEGIRLLELCTDRRADAAWRLQHLGSFAAKLHWPHLSRWRLS
jgi:2-succinyl-5-enolpyruvyl-6-hydroxy-3-cyclohexene-1-carboxylate synthase